MFYEENGSITDVALPHSLERWRLVWYIY